MARSADVRIAKYTAKYDATVVGSRFTATKDLAVGQEQIQQANLVAMESSVKTQLENSLTSPTEIPNYLAAAREIYGKARKYGGMLLYNEAQVVKAKWVARGLDADLMNIVLNTMGISVHLYS